MKKPSIRQIKAFSFINSGMSKRQAMIKAGYSLATANQAKRVMDTESMHGLIENFQEELANVGLDIDFWVAKMKEWANATKIVGGREFPDYQTQIKCFEFWKSIIREIENGEVKPKRMLTLEEFWGEEKSENVN